MESGEGEDETQQQEMKAASDDRMRAEVNSNIKTEMATWKGVKARTGGLGRENRSTGDRKASGRKCVRKATILWCQPV